MQTFETVQRGLRRGGSRADDETMPPMEMCERKIIARRAALELAPTALSTSESGCRRASPASRLRKTSPNYHLDRRTRHVGGVPAAGLSFGAAINPQAVIDQPYQFDFYDGGGLDIAFLGLARPTPKATQCFQVRPELGGRRWLHQHQPKRQESGFRRHLHRRRSRVAIEDGKLRSCRKAAQNSSTRSNTAPSAANTPARVSDRALRHGALRICLGEEGIE